MEEKIKVLVLAGPTASGKTSLSVKMAKALNGEIISADSMQVYRRMDVGTAKVTPEEADGIPHHLIDVIDPEEEWNVARFVEEAQEKIREIHARGKLPIICGGTGFYLHALLYAADFEEEEGQEALRVSLEQAMELLGPEVMHERLRQVDPISAEIIHPNNRKRVIRALEYQLLHGEPISDLNARQKERESAYNLAFLVLSMDRSVLYERIERRVDLMLEAGLVEEVERLLAEGLRPGMTAMQGIGYKEIVPYLQGERTLEESVYILKRDTRHFAKRQLTWFRREPDAHFLEMDGKTPEEVLDAALEAFRTLTGTKESLEFTV